MLPIAKKEELEELIEKKRKAGKDVSDLKRELAEWDSSNVKLDCNYKKINSKKHIISTGPIFEKDFE